MKKLGNLGIEKEKIKALSFAENQGNQGYLKLLLRLLAEIPEDSLVYADITYGTKPMSATVLYAMSFIEKMKDSEVEGIYYGEILRQNGKSISKPASLHDFTRFKYLSDIVEQMKYLEALKESIERYDPSKNFIKCILNKNYRQEAGKNVALGKLNGLTAGEPKTKKGVASDKPKTTKEVSFGRKYTRAVYLSQMVSKVKQVEDWMHNTRSIDELIEEVAKNSSYMYSKKDKEDAKTLLSMFNFIYLDQEIGDSQDDEMFTYGVLVPVEEKAYSEIEQEGLETFADFLAQLAEKGWDMINRITNKSTRDVYFDFSDSTLARILHKDKGQISHKRQEYETVMVPKMWEKFIKKENKGQEDVPNL